MSFAGKSIPALKGKTLFSLFSQGPCAVSPKANGTGDMCTWTDLAPLAAVEWKIQPCTPGKDLGKELQGGGGSLGICSWLPDFIEPQDH